MFGTNISAKVLATGMTKASQASADLAKEMDEANKSSKELGDNLLGIDEITNLSQEDTGTGAIDKFADRIAGLQDQFKALDDFKKKMQEVQEWFDKHPGIVNFFDTFPLISKNRRHFL